MEIRIMGSHWKESVKEFSPCQRNSSSKTDVRIMASRIIENQLYKFFYQLTFLIWVAIKSLCKKISKRVFPAPGFLGHN